jgi:erythromycin esterase
MKKLLLAILILFPALAFCQNDETSKDTVMAASFSYQPPKVDAVVADFVKINAKGIRGYADNFADLQFLKPLLKDKRIVMLGESSYGVAEYESIKSRITDFLNTEMGFGVIAFETGIAEASAANFNTNLSATATMQQALYKIWQTEQMLSVFKLVKASKTIAITGFDINASGLGYATYLKQFFRVKNDSLAEMAFNTDSLVTDYSFRYQRNDFVGTVRKSFEREKAQYVKNYQKLIAVVEKLNPTDETKMIVHVLQNRIQLIDNLKLEHKEYNEAQEKAMAANVEWLANVLYPNKKIIIWAHNTHISKKSDTSSRMAAMLSTSLKNDSYSIGFYMYKGVNASNSRTPFKLKRPADNSVEAIIHRANYKYAFLDLSGQTNNAATKWMFEKTDSFIFGIRNESIIPKLQYDGLLLIDKASMPTYISFK